MTRTATVLTYVEDQDQWWLPGIFRDVTLQARPVGGIEDVWLSVQYQADSLDEQVGNQLFEVTRDAADGGVLGGQFVLDPRHLVGESGGQRLDGLVFRFLPQPLVT